MLMLMCALGFVAGLDVKISKALGSHGYKSLRLSVIDHNAPHDYRTFSVTMRLFSFDGRPRHFTAS